MRKRRLWWTAAAILLLGLVGFACLSQMGDPYSRAGGELLMEVDSPPLNTCRIYRFSDIAAIERVVGRKGQPGGYLSMMNDAFALDGLHFEREPDRPLVGAESIRFYRTKTLQQGAFLAVQDGPPDSRALSPLDRIRQWFVVRQSGGVLRMEVRETPLLRKLLREGEPASQ